MEHPDPDPGRPRLGLDHPRRGAAPRGLVRRQYAACPAGPPRVASCLGEPPRHLRHRCGGAPRPGAHRPVVRSWLGHLARHPCLRRHRGRGGRNVVAREARPTPRDPLSPQTSRLPTSLIAVSRISKLARRTPLSASASSARVIESQEVAGFLRRHPLEWSDVARRSRERRRLCPMPRAAARRRAPCASGGSIERSSHLGEVGRSQAACRPRGCGACSWPDLWSIPMVEVPVFADRPNAVRRGARPARVPPRRLQFTAFPVFRRMRDAGPAHLTPLREGAP